MPKNKKSYRYMEESQSGVPTYYNRNYVQGSTYVDAQPVEASGECTKGQKQKPLYGRLLKMT